ncbi:Hpt domain-containing protein [Achromobacter piechaudii]|uniref:HPt domain-containing protein n=1 Tax=Achromobacter piechaudii TaxID=72556 RepID=A0ABM8L4U9_9BURK|nr:Hpt domain-containing protein [Achromobacter piechaudii]CAB3737377.1 hypothetical protein LMG1873_05380 [Achromobacter piechaudii]CAB3922127.1 hypothetical protein LMG2828_05668 [Achromobacter piechaudii]CAB3958244.1 hypothetical protein LMG6103_05347 [Achromobacter piechaudii]
MKKNDNEDPARSLDRRSPAQYERAAHSVVPTAARLRHERRVRTLYELTGADPARIRTLAHAFIKANDIDMGRVQVLHASNDRAALRQLAHRIKGAAQMTGDAQLSRLCSVLSEACLESQGDLLSLDAIVLQLHDALKEFGESCRRMAFDAQP